MWCLIRLDLFYQIWIVERNEASTTLAAWQDRDKCPCIICNSFCLSLLRNASVDVFKDSLWRYCYYLTKRFNTSNCRYDKTVSQCSLLIFFELQEDLQPKPIYCLTAAILWVDYLMVCMSLMDRNVESWWPSIYIDATRDNETMRRRIDETTKQRNTNPPILTHTLTHTLTPPHIHLLFNRTDWSIERWDEAIRDKARSEEVHLSWFRTIIS